MDPNETLNSLRALTASTTEELTDTDGNAQYSLDEALELFSALDEWLSKGGFLPTDWERS